MDWEVGCVGWLDEGASLAPATRDATFLRHGVGELCSCGRLADAVCPSMTVLVLTMVPDADCIIAVPVCTEVTWPGFLGRDLA